jgi:hypothetical protein
MKAASRPFFGRAGATQDGKHFHLTPNQSYHVEDGDAPRRSHTAEDHAFYVD